jgi:hypothetical protein
MMFSPHVRQSLEARITPVVCARWDVAASSDQPIDHEIADFVSWVLFERNDFLSLLRQILTCANRDGVWIGEFCDDVGTIPARFLSHPGKGHGVVITGWNQIPRWSVDRWIQSKRRPADIDGLVQYIPLSDGEAPGYRDVRLDDGALLVRATWEQESSDYDGFATLRSAYSAWSRLAYLTTLDGMLHERQGLGIPTVELPEQISAEDQVALERTLANLRADEQSYMILPHGMIFRWATSGGQPTSLSAAMEACVRDIFVNLGCGFLLLGDGGGSYALASEQRGIYAYQCEVQARFIEDVLNRGQDGFSIIERIVRMNYGDVAVPRVVARSLPFDDGLGGVLPQLVQAGLLTPGPKTEAHIRRTRGLPTEAKP